MKINSNPMKNIIIVLTFLVPNVLIAQSGKVFDNLSMVSKILDSERKYAIYLPPDYESSERSYPVLYLLHGGGDDQTGWVQFGEVLRITGVPSSQVMSSRKIAISYIPPL